MCNPTISAQELETLLETLPDVVHCLSSFEELVTWFQSQPCVASIDSPNYLIKTAPPRRELFAQFRMDDGSTVMRAIAVILYPDQTFDLADIYEP
ncbi:MAG TPA: hypothetical protein V6C46_10180 [Coleofasciculaceae cyanobacterium]